MRNKEVRRKVSVREKMIDRLDGECVSVRVCKLDVEVKRVEAGLT